MGMFDKAKERMVEQFAAPSQARTALVISGFAIVLSLLMLGVYLGSRNAH